MFTRAWCLALLLVTVGGIAWCQCLEDVLPPTVIQFKDEVGAGPVNVVIRELHLVNVIHATVDEQQQIAAPLIGFCFPESKKNAVNERIRYGFQRLGYFKARISADSIEAPDTSVNPPTVSVIARVEEGDRYRLKGITFTGNRVITNATILRNLFPIRDGDIFDTEKLRKGLDDLRYAYAELGYINFTPVPDTKIDDENKRITFTIYVDEGAQFFINSFTVYGADPQREAALRALWLQMLQPGRIYNAKLVKVFFAHASQLLPPDARPEKNLHIKTNSREHTVDLVLNASANAN